MFGLCFEQPDWGGILVSKCNGEDEKHPNSSAKSSQNCERAEPLLQTYLSYFYRGAEWKGMAVGIVCAE